MQKVTRRNVLAATTLVALGPATIARAGTLKFERESDKENVRSFHNVHKGLGTLGARIFNFAGAAAPANFLIYDIPVGASEGVHVHNLTDRSAGAYDEYYYIISGRGRMVIDGEPVLVGTGDHVHTPLEVSHGIENIDPTLPLKVFLTYIDRFPASSLGRPLERLG